MLPRTPLQPASPIAHALRQCLLLCFFCLFVSPLTMAQDDARITMNMRDAEIRTVAEWMATQTGRRIVLDPRVAGKITVLSSEPMTVEEAYRVFLAALDVYGFAAVDTGDYVRIIPNPAAKSAGGPVLDAFTNPGGSSVVTQVIRLHQVAAEDIANMLKPLVSTTGYLAALPSNNTLVVADQLDSVKRLGSLVKRLDDTGNLDIEVVRLQFATARELAALLSTMVSSGGTAGTGGGEGAAQAAGTGGSVTFAADERTNSVLVSGDPTRRAQVRALITRLDQPLTGEGKTQVIPLNYLDAKEVVPVLQSMAGSLQESAKDQASLGTEVNIVASESNNAIVITAPPALMEDMKDVLAKLDVQRRQVLVEAVIVEVNDEAAKKLGVEWSTNLANADGGEAVTNFFNDPPPGNIGDSALTLGTGLTLGLYRNGSLRGLVRALAEDTTSNLLSTPSIVTLDNQEAEILVGSNVPFITGQTTNSSSSTENPFTTIERKDIGITLKITPKINTQDAITLDVLQEVESISTSTVTGASDLVTDKRSIKTKVLIRNDDVLVLGGLIRDDTSDVIRKVPLLGDIPLAGKLFQAKDKRSEKRNLMVFLHPVIMDDAQVVEQVTRDRYEHMQKQQNDFGKPAPVLPEKKSPNTLPPLNEMKQQHKAPATP